MIISEQLMTPNDLELLNSLIGDHWHDISAPGLVEDSLCWENVRIETASTAIQLSLELTTINIAGVPDDYPCLHVAMAGPKSESAIRKGRIYFQGKDELIHEVWVRREKFQNFKNGELFFENEADISVAFRLETFWTSFTRAAHFSDTFNIQRTASLEDIEIPDILEEWEADLMDQYECSGEWIRLGGV